MCLQRKVVGLIVVGRFVPDQDCMVQAGVKGFADDTDIHGAVFQQVHNVVAVAFEDLETTWGWVSLKDLIFSGSNVLQTEGMVPM